ncbi:MAG: hypothetical protein HFE64_10550 [Lachnospiraceae bacterium]|jgi:hypothetical protein|nr:hypothetical protein [Lachnospiraceae bacterium]
MKKSIILLAIAALICSLLGACGQKTEPPEASSRQNSEIQQSSVPSENGELQLLSNRYGESACNTENGYYYLTTEGAKLRDDTYGMHLMYMDFATGREIYLCSTAGCKHDSLDCPAVFSYDDFPLYSTLLFVFGDHLYIISREYDYDNTLSQGVISFGGDGSTVESRSAALYRANLDGTDREKIYTFDAALTLEDKVIGNDKGIYVITKKLSSDHDGNQTYTTSSERKLMFLDLSTLSLSEVCSMDFGDSISWRILDCCQNNFLLCGTDFGREISREEKWDEDTYKEIYRNSSEVYALLSKEGGALREIARQSNACSNSIKLLGENLYLSSEENQNIEVLNIQTGEKRTLCALAQNLIMDAMDDMLCCRAWDLSGDPIWYFVDTKTGSITSSPLVNLCNGWSVEFRAETKTDVLFVYDYEATDHHDGSYEIHQYKHALMAKEDLFAGKDNYRKIEMIGPGQ